MMQVIKTSKATLGAALTLYLVGIATAQAQAQAPSAILCDSFARSYAQNASRQGQMFGGAAVGSLLGAGVGAVFAAAGPGAAIGATVGLIGGGSKRGATAQRLYEVAYQDCMAGKIR